MADAKTFDFYATASGATTPEDTVDVYTDAATAYEISQLEKKINSPWRYQDPSESKEENASRVADAEKELSELREILKKNKVVFHLKGLLSPAREKIEKRVAADFPDDQNGYNLRLDSELVAASIVKIVNSEGAEDTSTWDGDRAEQMIHSIPLESRMRILQKTIDLTLRTNYFESAELNADFS